MRALRASLGNSVAAKVRSGAELLRRAANSGTTVTLPTMLSAIDTLLGGGLRRGKMVELVSRRASGRFSIVMSTLVAATSMGEAAALIDLGDHFDPQLAAQNGADLRRLLWIRPRTVKEAVMSAEMITATGFQLVIVDVGLHPVRGRRAPDAAWVRLARTAESQNTAMLVSSPYPLTGTASEAVLKASFSRARWINIGVPRGSSGSSGSSEGAPPRDRGTPRHSEELHARSPRLLDGIDMHVTLEKHRHIKPGAQATQPFESADK